jgi:hypothetical protein
MNPKNPENTKKNLSLRVHSGIKAGEGGPGGNPPVPSPQGQTPISAVP